MGFKLTKSELRQQQQQLGQLEKFLPTLLLKKALLQNEISEGRLEIGCLHENYDKLSDAAECFGVLLSASSDFDLQLAAQVLNVDKRYDNIAGIEVPCFAGIVFANFSYDLFETPPWMDAVVVGLRALAEALARLQVAQDKQAALEKEFREVSIRVNLFEKILIPRAQRTIRKIKVFLSDQQLAAVAKGKVAKIKIEAADLAKLASESAHAN